MKTVGLITEYNPFHKGHKYHIQEAKRITDADCVVVLMSGNYVQRGEPAFFDKYLRTQIALEQGGDLVLELPVIYSTGSAELFAHGAVSILNRLEIIDSLCFGSEYASVNELSTIADILSDEPELYSTLLQNALKTGISFPMARTQAMIQYMLQTENPVNLSQEAINNILNTPNHILGIEYLKALHRTNSDILPFSITRIHSGYHDTGMENRFYSASALRTLSNNDSLFDSLADISPLYKDYFKTLGPITGNDFSLILGEKLLSASVNERLTDYTDISNDLANSITTHCSEFTDFNSFISLLKSKNLTYTRISRSLLHVMLGITDTLLNQVRASDGPSYVRVLGFNDIGKKILGQISPKISLLTKMAGYKNCLHTESDRLLFETNLHADHLYRMVQMNKYKVVIPNEFTRKLIVLS